MNRRKFLKGIAGFAAGLFAGIRPSRAGWRTYSSVAPPFVPSPCGYDDAVARDARHFYGKFLEGLTVPSHQKVPSKKTQLVELMRSTRPECRNVEVISDEDVQLYHIVETYEAHVIIRRIERAATRYKHFVDIGQVEGGEEAVRKELAEYRKKFKRFPVTPGTAGKNFFAQSIFIPRRVA